MMIDKHLRKKRSINKPWHNKLILVLFIFFFNLSGNLCLGWDGGAAFVSSPHPPSGSSGSVAEGNVVNDISKQAGASIIKFPENKTKFHVGDNITIILEIVDLKVGTSGLNGVIIEDYIPSGFNLKQNVSNQAVRVEKDKTGKITMHIGSESNWVPSGEKWQYVIQATKSGEYAFDPALLERAKRSSDTENLAHVPSNTLYINIENRKPRFINWCIPSNYVLWSDEKNIVTANITDDDGDQIKSCTLSSSLHGFIRCLNNSTANNSRIYNYSWDLSPYSGKQSLLFDASDGKDNTTMSAEINVDEKLFGIPISTDFKWILLIGILGVVVGESAISFISRLLEPGFSIIINPDEGSVSPGAGILTTRFKVEVRRSIRRYDQLVSITADIISPNTVFLYPSDIRITFAPSRSRPTFNSTANIVVDSAIPLGSYGNYVIIIRGIGTDGRESFGKYNLIIN